MVYGSDGWGGELAYAQVKGFLVLSSSSDVLQQVIDTAKGNQPGLNEEEDYKDLLKELPTRRAGYLYVDYQAVAEQMNLSDLPSNLRAWAGSVQVKSLGSIRPSPLPMSASPENRMSPSP